ncbi:4Fe-4S ferredoxin, iron-sulfur binding domain protein [Desulfitobacterium hafniense DCB-2]|uniref:Ferredoxin-like protein n=1 Tax=Desulfitobacterium hafniense (strain DSM 10664 / DCB-2) TaxID=272564 RepID=B8FXK3_DESHD|nr:4Fe-4S dicluster domain-containing protein [Desulfitobacterium hafniense]ACL22604.1 4Fe-4S ferredoxin, iron-sulfur binding domain protein [Desulfitobacterium hafniense DCB-2]
MKKLSLADKLSLNKFEVNEGEPHIRIDQQVCRTCREKSCLTACPAGLYSEQNDQITVEWAGCLECGTCRIICGKKAISWEYPQGGFGIIYRQG